VPVRFEPSLHLAKKGQRMLPQVPAITPWLEFFLLGCGAPKQ
jgi:hypothetical protein